MSESAAHSQEQSELRTSNPSCAAAELHRAGDLLGTCQGAGHRLSWGTLGNEVVGGSSASPSNTTSHSWLQNCASVSQLPSKTLNNIPGHVVVGKTCKKQTAASPAGLCRQPDTTARRAVSCPIQDLVEAAMQQLGKGAFSGVAILLQPAFPSRGRR